MHLSSINLSLKSWSKFITVTTETPLNLSLKVVNLVLNCLAAIKNYYPLWTTSERAFSHASILSSMVFFLRVRSSTRMLLMNFLWSFHLFSWKYLWGLKLTYYSFTSADLAGSKGAGVSRCSKERYSWIPLMFGKAKCMKGHNPSISDSESRPISYLSKSKPKIRFSSYTSSLLISCGPSTDPWKVRSLR